MGNWWASACRPCIRVYPVRKRNPLFPSSVCIQRWSTDAYSLTHVPSLYLVWRMRGCLCTIACGSGVGGGSRNLCIYRIYVAAYHTISTVTPSHGDDAKAAPVVRRVFRFEHRALTALYYVPLFTRVRAKARENLSLSTPRILTACICIGMVFHYALAGASPTVAGPALIVRWLRYLHARSVERSGI